MNCKYVCTKYKYAVILIKFKFFSLFCFCELLLFVKVLFFIELHMSRFNIKSFLKLINE